MLHFANQKLERVARAHPCLACLVLLAVLPLGLLLAVCAATCVVALPLSLARDFIPF